MLYLKLAWRNIWRNRRRTLITLFIIMIAVTLAIVMRAQQEGSYKQMIKNTAGTFVGHIQIHQKGYWEEQNLDNSLEENDEIMKEIKTMKGVKKIIPRLESYGLLAGEDKSRAGLIVGIDPESESYLSNPEQKLLEGKYFTAPDEQAALIGVDLAKFLELEIGDSIVIIGQGYQAQNAVGKYLVKGIFKYPTPAQNKSMIFLPITETQELFLAYGRLTSYKLITNDPNQITKISEQLQEKLTLKDFEVMSWQELLPELRQMIVSDKVGGFIMIGILYMVVGFGIFGTIIMMTAERRFEFGVLIGIGMSRFALGLTVFLEIIMLSLLGVLVGSVLISPMIWYFNQNPIHLTGDVAKAIEEMGFEAILVYANDFSLYFDQAVIVFIITFLISFYPLWLTSRIKPVEAMRN